MIAQFIVIVSRFFLTAIYDLCTSSAKFLRAFREITVQDYRDYQLRHGPFWFLYEVGVTRFALISTRSSAARAFTHRFVSASDAIEWRIVARDQSQVRGMQTGPRTRAIDRSVADVS